MTLKLIIRGSVGENRIERKRGGGRWEGKEGRVRKWPPLCSPLHFPDLTPSHTLVPTYTSKEDSDNKSDENESSSKGFYWPRHSRECTCLGNVSVC